MVYQNNNNRIVPKAVEDRNLKPAATPQNKLITYNPAFNQGNITQWNNTASALSSIGKGMVDMDNLWRREAEENAIKAAWETSEENRNEWKKVSKNIKGAAKFNPYNDDAYRRLQAQDIADASFFEFATTPDLDTKTYEEFVQLREDKLKQMMEAFKETKLSPKDYGNSLVNWNTASRGLEQNYITKNAEYRFKELKVKYTSALTRNMQVKIDEADDDTRISALSDSLKEFELEADKDGWSNQSKSEVIIGGLKNYIARNADQLDDSEILAAISGYQFTDGSSLNDVVPNYDIMVRDLCSQARQAQLNQMKLAIELDDFKQEQSIKETMTDFIQQYTSGKLTSPDAIQNFAKEAMNKYKLNGLNSIKLFNSLANGEKTWAELSETPSDQRVYARLATKVITGEADYEEIANAIGNGLNAKDGIHLMQNLQTQEKKQQTVTDKAVNEHLKSARQEFLEGFHKGDTDIDAILLDPDKQEVFERKLNTLITQYKNDCQSMSPSDAYKKFNDELALTKSAHKYATEMEGKEGYVKGMMAGYESLQATPQIADAQWAKVDMNKSTKALRKLGITHTNIGTKDTGISIESAPQKNRKITVTENGKTYTKNSRHTGYDLKGSNIYAGRPVFAPMDGEVVGVLPTSRSGGQGNMVLIKCQNGNLIKYMHLQSAGLPQLGQKVNSRTPIGHIGNTGAVGKGVTASLHVEFYNKNKQWITADQFLNS